MSGEIVNKYLVESKHSRGRKLYPMVKHGGGSVMVWGCFAASGPGRLASIEGTMNSALYQIILKENVRPLIRELKLKHKLGHAARQ